ncbi:hypothetical protein PCANB_001002 [Pneumocystis canis]|nr:hypothetical protein PCANB_001002 [Pneumocystis canis]
MDNLLFFLNQENGESNNALCEKMHNETCNYFKNLTGNSQYDCNDSTNTCTELEKTLKENLLQKEIKNIELFSKDNKSFPEASLIDWPKLNPSKNGKHCKTLKSKYFYSRRYENITKACQTLKIFKCTDLFLQDQIITHAKKSSYKYAKHSGTKVFRNHIHIKALGPQSILKTVPDLPTKNDCCWVTLKAIPCIAKKLLLFTGTTEIKKPFIRGKKNHFQNVVNCNSTLNQRFSSWSRKINNKFSLSYTLQNDTCNMMISDVKTYCTIFSRNIETFDIVNKLKGKNDIDQLKKSCSL